MKLKYLVALVFCASVVSGFSVSSACNHAPPTLSPQGQVAFTADQAVVRVNELMNAAIQANATGGLDTPTTRVIMTFAVDADAVLAKTPNGWIATVQATWAKAKADPRVAVIAPTSPVGLLLAAADVAIAGLK